MKFSRVVPFFIFLALGSIGSVGGCTSSSSSSSSRSGGSGTVALTGTQIAGTHYAPCFAVTNNTSYGAGMDGTSFLKSITITSTGSYSVNTLIFSGTTCDGSPSNYEIAAYNQNGSYTLGSVTSSGATEIKYTSNNSSLTVFGGVSGGAATASAGNAWVTDFNTECSGSPNFTSGSESLDASVGGTICNGAIFELPEFPADGTQFYDLVKLNSTMSPSTFTTSTALNIWQMGQFSSYPTSANYSYSF
jgi:hypothetical protein